jgi:hypothetical protein
MTTGWRREAADAADGEERRGMGRGARPGIGEEEPGDGIGDLGEEEACEGLVER